MKKVWIILTAATLLLTGIILHLSIGDMFSYGDSSIVYFAAGNFSAGVFSAGVFSIGIFSIGIFSIGIFSVSIFNIAFYAIGIFMIARKKKMVRLV